MKFASDKSITEEFIHNSYHGRCESLIYFVRGPGETSGDQSVGSRATNYNLLLWDPSESHYDWTLRPYLPLGSLFCLLGTPRNSILDTKPGTLVKITCIRLWRVAITLLKLSMSPLTAVTTSQQKNILQKKVQWNADKLSIVNILVLPICSVRCK